MEASHWDLSHAGTPVYSGVDCTACGGVSPGSQQRGPVPSAAAASAHGGILLGPQPGYPDYSGVDLKKLHFLIEIVKHYWPVSNLSFISKIIEKHVNVQMIEHDEIYDLAEDFQSAYTKFCSTETAPLRVKNDLLTATDSKGAAILVLLDLSAAFDTIDHQLLISRLDHAYGKKDDALTWMKSYLTGHTQMVVINGNVSSTHVLEYGFSQGSVLEPKNFKRYSKPIGIIARKHRLGFHLYADDSQLYVTLSPKDTTDLHTTIERVQIVLRKCKSGCQQITSNVMVTKLR